MTLTIALVFFIVILVVTLYFLGRICKGLQEDYSNLQIELSKQKKVACELTEYIKQLTKINDDMENVADKIKEAENDEELLEIIAGLVCTNNDRVRKQTNI